MTRTATAFSAFVAALALTACGASEGEGAPTPEAASSSAAATFNEADVTFATDMIPHHQQAVEMATLADERAGSDEVKALAAEIADAQDPEIRTMSDWLTAWGRPVPQDMSGMDMSGSMPGMMSPEEMSGLAESSGADFDTRFLTMMVAHHEGAVDMARTQSADGSNPEAVALAREIEQAQAAEIETMRSLLDE